MSLFYKFRREVYIGASLGFALCLLFGVGFLALASLTYQLLSRGTWKQFWLLLVTISSKKHLGLLEIPPRPLKLSFLQPCQVQQRLFDGDNERIFQFCMMSLTCVVLTFLAVNFYKMPGGTMGNFFPN